MPPTIPGIPSWPSKYSALQDLETPQNHSQMLHGAGLEKFIGKYHDIPYIEHLGYKKKHISPKTPLGMYWIDDLFVSIHSGAHVGGVFNTQ